MPTSELLLYFAAEKQGAILIAAIGVASGILAAYLWLAEGPFRAMAWPLAAIGLGQLALGVGLFLRTDPQIARLLEGLRSRPQATMQSELARMEKVNRSFKVIEAAEVAALATGLFLALALRQRHPAWAAVGMGLVVQAAVTLVFDLFAEHRALAYTRWLAELSRSTGGGLS
ncbi:MAG: hypothetical protein WAU32_06990 [Thermoanaerobaculia bacterium]